MKCCINYLDRHSHLTLSLGLVCLVSSVSFVTNGWSQEPSTYVELSNAMKDRGDQFFGRRYTYRFHNEKLLIGVRNSESYGHMVSGVRVVEIGIPKDGAAAVPYRILQFGNENLVKSDFDMKDVLYWEASDTLESRRFCRFIVGDKCNAHPEHIGFVNAGPWAAFLDTDPFIITLKPGTSKQNMKGRVEEVNPDFDITTYDLYFSPEKHGKFGEVYIVGLSGKGIKPSYGLISSGPEYYCLGGGDSPSITEMVESVDEFVTYDGVRYPRSGRYSTDAMDGRFELLNVERFVPASDEQWLLDWPDGTTVLDSVLGTTKRIPFSTNELKGIKDQLRANCRTVVPERPSSLNWLLVINGGLAISFLLYLFQRRRLNRQIH